MAKRQQPAQTPAAKDERPAEAWERQPGEPTKAFAAFRDYLEAGTDRSLAKLVHAAKAGGKRGRTKTTVDGWSRRWRWSSRVAAFEAAAAARADDAHMDMLARRARRQAELAQLQGEASSLVAVEIMRRIQEDRRRLQTIDFEKLLAMLPPHVRAHNRAVITERLASGASTENIEPPNPMTEAEKRQQGKTDEELDRDLAGIDPDAGDVVPEIRKAAGG